MTSKGQITIPKAIREHLHLRVGDTVAFTLEDGKVIVSPITLPVQSLKGLIAAPSQAVSNERMQEAIKRRGGSL